MDVVTGYQGNMLTDFSTRACLSVVAMRRIWVSMSGTGFRVDAVE